MAESLKNEDWPSEREKLISEPVSAESPLRLLEDVVETPTTPSHAEEWIRSRVAAGQTVVSYMVEHRQADGSPTTFRPRYN